MIREEIKEIADNIDKFEKDNYNYYNYNNVQIYFSYTFPAYCCTLKVEGVTIKISRSEKRFLKNCIKIRIKEEQEINSVHQNFILSKANFSEKWGNQ